MLWRNRKMEKIITDWKDKVFISKGMLHPFHLILEIQVKGTGMYTSRWADYSITLDVSESAVAISPLAAYFCDTSCIKTKCKSNIQSIYNVTSFIKIFRVANKAPEKVNLRVRTQILSTRSPFTAFSNRTSTVTTVTFDMSYLHNLRDAERCCGYYTQMPIFIINN